MAKFHWQQLIHFQTLSHRATKFYTPSIWIASHLSCHLQIGLLFIPAKWTQIRWRSLPSFFISTIFPAAAIKPQLYNFTQPFDLRSTSERHFFPSLFLRLLILSYSCFHAVGPWVLPCACWKNHSLILASRHQASTCVNKTFLLRQHSQVWSCVEQTNITFATL